MAAEPEQNAEVTTMLRSTRRYSLDGFDLDSVKRKVKWESYVGAGKGKEGSENTFITQADVEAIRQIDGLPQESVQEYLDTEPAIGYHYSTALMHILRNITNEDVLLYTLCLLEDFLIPNVAQRIPYFSGKVLAKSGGGHSIEPVVLDLTPLLRNLSNDSLNIRQKAAYVVGLFLSVKPEETEALEEFMTWTCEQLRGATGVLTKAAESTRQPERKAAAASAPPSIVKLKTKESSVKKETLAATTAALPPQQTKSESSLVAVVGKAIQDCGLRSVMYGLNLALKTDKGRLALGRHGGVKFLLPLQSLVSGNIQLMYEVSFSLWLCTFANENLPDFTPALLGSIVQVIRGKPRDKVVRLGLATLRNVIKLQPEKEQDLCELLLSMELMRLLDTMDISRVIDNDMVDDINWLKNVLAKNFRVLSTFECYEQELRTGKLKPGVVHEERFWRENAKRFEAKDFIAFKRIVALLTEINDSTTLALACSDIGFFTQFYPNGRAIANALNAKPKVMALLANSDPLVNKEALTACSKMMVTNWEFLAKTS